ncbi:MAG TPA: ABC transporter ATP-binding protein [Candidatus Methylomirabilis sp.]|nr:ABC transporter ATP-binding protein [Candidatus Methylomirabilis sp.]
MLEVRGLAAAYGELLALRGLSLTVGEGELVALLGSNGAGKSTTLRTISGLLRPRAGSITFAGERIDGLRPPEIVARGVVQVPEGRHLFPSLTVRENLLAGARTRPARAARPDSLAGVERLFPVLRERAGQLAGTLSGGEQQMVAIGRALMARPRLLMLDEPSLGLAPVVVTAIFQALQAINRAGTPILLVEQNAARALALSRRGYVLENGAIVLEGPSAVLLRDPLVREAYLGM